MAQDEIAGHGRLRQSPAHCCTGPASSESYTVLLAVPQVGRSWALGLERGDQAGDRVGVLEAGGREALKAAGEGTTLGRAALGRRLLRPLDGVVELTGKQIQRGKRGWAMER